MTLNRLLVPLTLLLMLCAMPARAEEGLDPLEPMLALPPASLAQWYKPVNERQVWLHIMFRLRQSMQAIEHYREAGDLPALKRWAATLKETYAKVPEMVPEWENASRQGIAADLYRAAMDEDLAGVADHRRRLQKFCDACHMEWQPLVTALYRSPDYRRVQVTTAAGEVSFPEMMERLSQTLGVLKIAREDGNLAQARQSTGQLRDELELLGGSCRQCHRDQASHDRILGDEIQQQFERLEQALHEPHDPKQSGRALGTIGFKVCGRCHSIHRTLGNLRGWLQGQ